MQIRAGIIEAIGNTPLIKLERPSAATGCTILGKAEFMNPGQSVKDRAALFIIQDAVKKGELRPGGVIVEGTAGNTGIGLALVGNAMGFRSVIVIPDTQSQEKKDTLRLCGAELIEVPAVAYSNPNNYVKVSGRLAAQLAKSETRAARSGPTSSTTSPTVKATLKPPARKSGSRPSGKIDGFTCAVGTGGTLAGVAMALKARNPKVRIALADPMGAALYSYYTTGKLKSEGSSITEGIGQGRITKNLEDAPIDTAYQIPDAEAVPIIFDLLRTRGPVPRRLLGHQHRRRHSPCERARPRPHHRHRARRLRHALPVKAVQSGISSLEGPAGAAVARAQIRHQGSVRINTRKRNARWRVGIVVEHRKLPCRLP